MAEPLYVSCVDGKPVTRFALGGRGGARQGSVIGAVRGEGRAYTYNPRAVVMISAGEVEKFGREYERAIADKHLVRRTEDDFEAWQLAQKAAEKKALEEQKKAADAAAKDVTP